MSILIVLVVWCSFGAVVGWLIGESRGDARTGALLGGLLGVIGWLIILLRPHNRRKCPACLSAVPDGATRCRHCGGTVAWQAPDSLYKDRSRWWAAARPVACPQCGDVTKVEPQMLNMGVVCAKCATGFVPEDAIKLRR